MERTGIFYMKKFLAEFKEFAMRGNVMDLAVGVIIGGPVNMYMEFYRKYREESFV